MKICTCIIELHVYCNSLQHDFPWIICLWLYFFWHIPVQREYQCDVPPICFFLVKLISISTMILYMTRP